MCDDRLFSHVNNGLRASGLPAVFVDRDGVLNHVVVDLGSGVGESPLNPEDVEIVDGAGFQIGRLRAAGWLVVCVTNQPAAAKGTIELDVLLDIHDLVCSLLARDGGMFDGQRICLHHPEGVIKELSGACGCRKPAPGMLVDAAREYGIDLSRSWMIGDTDDDVRAGRAAGVRTILVTTNETQHKRTGRDEPDVTVPDISAAVDEILTTDSLDAVAKR